MVDWRGRDGLPRPRGDGPGKPLGLYDGLGAPPPTRGWTARLPVVAGVEVGSPAHAGMDPGARCPA